MNGAQNWVNETAKESRGIQAVHAFMLDIDIRTGEDWHDKMLLADWALEAYRGVFSPQRNVWYAATVKDATPDEVRVVEVYRHGFSKNMRFGEIERLESLSKAYPLPLGIDPERVTQFSPRMLEYTNRLLFSAGEKEVILAALGVRRNNQIVDNADKYRYHPDLALEDKSEPDGRGGYLKASENISEGAITTREV